MNLPWIGRDKVQKLTFTNSRGETIEFGNSAPYVLSNIEGTGGVETEIQTTKAPFQDGSTLHDVILQTRAISIEGAVIGKSREDMYMQRQKLARVLNPKLGAGVLRYQNDAGIKEIEAVAEQSPVFKERHSNNNLFLVSLVCPSPFWLDQYEAKEEIAAWLGDVQFPFEITSEGAVMGHRESNLIVNVNNTGDVDCGMRIEFKALASVTNPSLLDVNTREFIKIKQTLQSGDKLTICTSFGKKKVELYRGGVISNVFNFIDLDSTFLQLAPGDNLLRYDAEAGIDNLEVSIYYRPQYVGV